MEALLSVYKRYSSLVNTSFEEKPMFVGALDKVRLCSLVLCSVGDCLPNLYTRLAPGL